MFDLADDPTCLWRRLAGHFAEAIEACSESCGNCLGRDIAGEARHAGGSPGKRERQKQRLAPEGSPRPRDGFDTGPYEPDGDTRQRLVPIDGQPPDLTALPPGCAFMPRCKLATDQCGLSRPALRPVRTNHFKACFLHDHDHN